MFLKYPLLYSNLFETSFYYPIKIKKRLPLSVSVKGIYSKFMWGALG